MNRLIVILFCLVSIIVCFFSRMWGWIILAIPFAYLSQQALGVKYKFRKFRSGYIPELSLTANSIFQRHAHYYLMPYAGTDFSSASSAAGISAIAISVIGLFFQSWWGIILGFVAYWLSCLLGRFYNPTLWLKSPMGKEAHEEIIRFVEQKGRQQILSGEVFL